MPRTAPISDDTRTRILALHSEGRTRNDIARETGVSGSTVTKVVKAAGRTFDRSATRAATEARQADLAERRSNALERELQILEESQTYVLDVVRGQRKHRRILKEPMGAESPKVIDFLPADDAQRLANARSSSVTIINRLTDNDTSTEAAKSVLVGLANALGVHGPHDQPDDTDASA